MRQFVCLAHEVPTTPSFSLDDIAGGAGRLDALCRSLTAALLRSHGIREDVRVHLVLQDELTITVDGGAVRRLNPDERSTAARIKTALEHRDEAIGALPAEPSPGFEVYRRGFEATLDALDDDATLVHLHEDGDPLVDGPLPEHPVFVLSDHGDFTAAERDLLETRADRRARLGPLALHADQAITVAHHALDTDGYAEW
ncbi:tRNA (pseudouridine(54)-N(1))-methyltransferase TrmY [Halovivax cerinus]|uniref:tRNA (pseudouridine(54)-N(1))-methyltransferase n=1 Tax=Halovivax cerinus TaxID=1487865 RepID=A0ABD5NT76_9EURY|nr:tRNA (pseudouridine(54)-N(1))-methyltransferase TrmY [Halovivax cerinus]